MANDINTTLGLTPLIEYNPDNSVAVSVPIEEQLEYDINFARNALYDAVSKSQSAVGEMVMLAQQSQHPKAFEVLNAMIKTLADVSTSIVDLQLKKQRLLGNVTEEAKVVNNNMFVGSTAELQRMIANLTTK